MRLNGLFKDPQNTLEEGGRVFESAEDKEQEKAICCPLCKTKLSRKILQENLYVCKCGYHFRIRARQRIRFLTDPGSFIERNGELESEDILSFYAYKEKLEKGRRASGELESVLCGEAAIGGQHCALFVMEPNFMMGSLGTVAGEKITRLFEWATAQSLPVVGYTASGGARMQEGILSLMQMAKVSGAVKRHGEKGNFYLTVLTDPTMGGVTASFAMEGDMIMAEPGAMVGFAGARVIEQTIRKKLPQDFQRAEFLLEHGFVDLIVPRRKQKETVAEILALHNTPGGSL